MYRGWVTTCIIGFDDLSRFTNDAFDDMDTQKRAALDIPPGFQNIEIGRAFLVVGTFWLMAVLFFRAFVISNRLRPAFTSEAA